jgi:hypothetical protein
MLGLKLLWFEKISSPEIGFLCFELPWAIATPVFNSGG